MNGPTITPAPEALVVARHLTLAYGRRVVLRDVSLTIHAGEFWCLLGANGQGKTTFVHAVLGLLAPAAGEFWRAPRDAALDRVGFVPQRCDLNPTVPTTVREFVLLGLVGASVPVAERATAFRWALAETGLEGLERASYWALSGGQRQRALVARALVRRPRLLVLDEPTSGLDPAAEEGLLRCLDTLNRRDGLTLVAVTHDVATAARHATHVALFHDGAVTSGPRDTVLTTASLDRVYGARVAGGPA